MAANGGYTGLVPDERARETLRGNADTEAVAALREHMAEGTRPTAEVVEQVVSEMDVVARRVHGARITDHRFEDGVWHFREFNGYVEKGGRYRPETDAERERCLETIHREIAGAVILDGDAWEDDIKVVYHAIHSVDPRAQEGQR
ncbi:hypothetical protein C441_04629 [Haloferax sulfurifontis ATCC BAA-897]|nr:hypothetical protein C441_04629 [Haloferax sulfurifontis ATCC BAA-897]